MEEKLQKIELEPDSTVEDAVVTLLAYKEMGKHVYCEFNDHKLYSDTVTMDSAYKEITGFTKAEFDREKERWLDETTTKMEEEKERDQKNAQKIRENREREGVTVTPEKIIAGLKYIAEHRSLSQEELVDGLLELGCNFSREDCKMAFPEDSEKEMSLYEGMKQCNMLCGAMVIANARDTEYSRTYIDDRFLSKDDETSIYHFIRVVTNDDTYTKEKIDSVKKY